MTLFTLYNYYLYLLIRYTLRLHQARSQRGRVAGGLRLRCESTIAYCFIRSRGTP